MNELTTQQWFAGLDRQSRKELISKMHEARRAVMGRGLLTELLQHLEADDAALKPWPPDVREEP